MEGLELSTETFLTVAQTLWLVVAGIAIGIVIYRTLR